MIGTQPATSGFFYGWRAWGLIRITQCGPKGEGQDARSTNLPGAVERTQCGLEGVQGRIRCIQEQDCPSFRFQAITMNSPDTARDRPMLPIIIGYSENQLRKDQCPHVFIISTAIAFLQQDIYGGLFSVGVALIC